jgi:hypothetical protein
MLTGCSPRRATTVEPGLCTRSYTVYARQVKQEQASEWRAERVATEEQPDVPFYRPRHGLCHQLAFGVLSRATMVLRGRWTVVDGAACSETTVPNLHVWSVPNLHPGRCLICMHGRCLICISGRWVLVCVVNGKSECALLVCVVNDKSECTLLVCVVNGKSGCCLAGCFVLLHLPRIYEYDVAIHGEERWRKR